ncbi:MAG TPA: hypothetical protein VNP03_18620 [Pseudonocardia sp.]|nr:hypothetical protein [Pseudonocardia sp.]
MHARALYVRATVLLSHRADEPAQRSAEQAFAIGERLGRDSIIASAQMILGASVSLQGEPQRGAELLAEAVQRAGRSGARWVGGRARQFQIWVLLHTPTPDPTRTAEHALELLCEAVELFEGDEAPAGTDEAVLSWSDMVALPRRFAARR